MGNNEPKISWFLGPILESSTPPEGFHTVSFRSEGCNNSVWGEGKSTGSMEGDGDKREDWSQEFLEKTIANSPEEK
jgi:hypothetical protein